MARRAPAQGWAGGHPCQGQKLTAALPQVNPRVTPGLYFLDGPSHRFAHLQDGRSISDVEASIKSSERRQSRWWPEL